MNLRSAMGRGFQLPASLAAALITAGCASAVVLSTPVAENAGLQVGMAYSLPKAQLKLVAQRKKVDAEEVALAVKAAADAAAALDVAKAREAQAKAALKDLIETDAATDAKKIDAKADLAKQVAIAQAWLSVATKRLQAAQALADAANKDRAALVGNLGKWVETAALTFLPSVPDAGARFVANMAENLARDDAVKVSVASGLLSSSTSTSTDQTAAVILNLIQASAAKRATASSKRVLEFLGARTAPEPAECKAFQFSRTLDPTDLKDVQAAALKLLEDSGGSLALSVDNFGCDKEAGVCKVVAWSPARHRTHVDTVQSGYVYRSARSVDASVTPRSVVDGCGSREAAVAVTASAVVPDSTTAFVLPTRAGAFVKTKLEFTFKDGMPVDYSIDQPSQLAAITGLPLAIAKAILEVPASIIKLRVDYESQSAALADARVKLAKSQLELQKASEALDAERD